jgi:type I restriction enzyme S subunit
MRNKMKITDKQEQARPALVPKLRFPEFRDAEGWTLEAGVSLFDQINDRKPEPGLHVLAITQEHGAIPRHMIDYHVSVTEKSIDSYKVVRIGDFIISLRSFQGGIEYSRYHGICSPAYVILRRLGKGSNEYYRHYLKTDRFIRILTKNLEGLRDGKMISYSQFSELLLPTPMPAEQQKIAECLSSVDELIAAQARKVDALKTHKKGLMQQLFPREGETQPRLRFPEFQNAGEWEVKAIGNVFKVTRGEVLSMKLVQDEASDEAPFPVYSSQTINKGLAGYYSEYLYQDAITWTTDGANAGDVNFRPGKFYCTNVCGVLINTNGCANPCIAALLNSVTRSHVSYVGNPKLMNGVMAKIEIPFPSVAEQYRIAKFLSSLDALITAETQKYDAVKTHKKGLMQQLFPSLEHQS